MSHAAPSLSGLASRQSTFGVTTQKCLIAEPRLFGHAPATLCFDAYAQLHIENTNRSVKARLHLQATLNERIPISLFMLPVFFQEISKLPTHNENRRGIIHPHYENDQGAQLTV